MKFRPCIDLHEGKVKQIVGETLHSNRVAENFVSAFDSTYYASLFKRDRLSGGHVIMLGPDNERAALAALETYPNGLQIGGGIHLDNAEKYLQAGATHVIVTSFIFRDGQLHKQNLLDLIQLVGKENLVIDLSCKEKNGRWYVVTNQWNTFSDFEVNEENIKYLEQYCDEFLIHAVDVEGKQSGIQQTLVQQLAQWTTIPTTYAGGARSLSDLQLFRNISNSKLDITVGSALDIFGGTQSYDEIVAYHRSINRVQHN
ncbi:phosphoribosylformimino-5-aminoimidazole carboxamide ribotide isomerase [Paenibacillus yanchengensis]|uniref:Phosphoribosylformimino-5-aminoimidazole carboxamide ribotide isomerase n=1 Tax=Paenibacillus yanchengensis TaxID=2035833 RepID=A0ABW4YM04_9BACL